MSIVISVFTRHGFRATPDATVPIRLIRGRWWGPYVWGSRWPAAIADLANYIVVHVDIVARPDAMHEMTIRVQSVWSSQQAERLILTSLDDVLSQLSSAGTLVSAGPITETATT
jgi:hypothetical protein